MSAITQSYKIDMTSGAVPLRIKVSQYDAGIRTLTFALFNLGAKLTSAQLSSLTAYVQGTKQDKKGFVYECTTDFSAEGCSVTVAITEQMTACAGDVVCELVLVAGDDRIGSANFILEVERAALGADTDISETELPDIITAGRQYAAQAEDAAERAEEAAADVDNYALAGAGMMTEYSAGVIDTNIYLHREPKIGDRLLIMFTQTFTENTPIKIYKENGGTAYTLNFDMWSTAFVLKGLCLVEVVDFLDNFALRWLHSYSGTDYQAGQYIGINGNYINNIAPQLGDNSEYHEKDSAITDGNLGTYGYYAKYIIINFKARAVPNDTTGKYSLQLSKGATLEDASLVDRDGNDFTAPIKTGVILLCSVDNSNDIVTVLNNDIMANGDIIDGQGNTLSVLAEALTKTASGNPITITDCAGGKARSLKTTIEPIQDLHGYDKPWVGGANGNLFGNFTFSDSRATHEYTELTGTLKVICNQAQGRGAQTALTISDVSNLLGKTLTWSITGYDRSKSSLKPYVTVYKNGQTSLANFGNVGEGITKTSTSFAVPNDTQSLLFLFRVDQSETDVSGDYLELSGLQLEIGNSVSSFRPYANECPISGRTEARVDTENEDSSESAYATIQLGQTVYGADINWDTGVATLTHAFIIYDGSSDEEWSASAAGSGAGYRCRIVTPTDAKIPSNNGETANIICNQFKAKTENQTYLGNEGISIQNGGGNPLDVYSVSFNTSDISLWKTYLSNNPLQVCYELATPTTIQLTPTQLQMLKGYNRVTIDSGSIEVGYISKIS